MRIIFLDEGLEDFRNWILENFESEENYLDSILEFKGLDFFQIENGFLDFR